MPDKEYYNQLAIEVGSVFTPNTPIRDKEMFSGRIDQIRKTLDVIFQSGQHAIIFGDRGVGKTSLAKFLTFLLPSQKENVQSALKVNCDTNDDFNSVWEKVFGELKIKEQKEQLGFNNNELQERWVSVDNQVKGVTISPHLVIKMLVQISNEFMPVIIIDEFDRLRDEIKGLFADLIKSLSDHSLDATIILIGVGDSVDQLIREHESVSRALVQINMPRMSGNEIKEIIKNGLTKLGMTIDELTLVKMSDLSKGLPYYAHLLAKHAARGALDSESLNITDEHLTNAIVNAIEDTQHSIKSSYLRSIRSTNKSNLFADVLLACAMTTVNELGEFAAQDIKNDLHTVTSRKYEIAAFVRHLDEFSSPKRENILIKTGARKLFRYKFKDPLMQSYVIMQGIKNGKIGM